MADTGNTRTTLDGLYKIVYPDGIENALPDQTWLLGNTDFVQIGETYKVPVTLTIPGGATFGGLNDVSTGGTAYDLGEAIASLSKKLNVEGYSITLRDVVGLGAAKAARGGKESFKDTMGHVFEGLQLAMSRLVETTLLDGQSGSGQGVVDSTGSGNFVVTAASWAPSRWIGKKTHKIACCDRTTEAPNSSVRSGLGTISAVNYATRTITYSGTITSITADDAVMWANLQASDGTTQMTEWTGTAWNECLGMIPATAKTGTVWGQDNTGYDLIRGDTTSAGSTDLSFDTCSSAMGKIWDKGGTGEFVMFVSSETWGNLISPEVALRRHDSSYNKANVSVGHNEITFNHITGTLKIKPHAFIKQGEALIIQPKLWTRVGSTDITFQQDTGDGKQRIFLTLANKNGFEVRCFSDQAPFTRRLGYAGFINNIVNS